MALPIPGRTYDLSVFQGNPLGSAGLQTISLLDVTGPQGAAVTGTLKLVQRVLLELLTDIGSMLYQPARGCGFMPAVKQGLIQSDIALFQQFAFAANQIARTLSNDALPADPPDELLATLELANAIFSPGQIAMSVQITSQAGTSASLLLPISTGP